MKIDWKALVRVVSESLKRVMETTIGEQTLQTWIERITNGEYVLRECAKWMPCDYIEYDVEEGEVPCEWECSSCGYESNCICEYNYCPKCGRRIME